MTPLFVQLLELSAHVTDLRFFQQDHVSARYTFLCLPCLADPEVIQHAYGFGQVADSVQHVMELRLRRLKHPGSESHIQKLLLRKRLEYSHLVAHMRPNAYS